MTDETTVEMTAGPDTEGQEFNTATADEAAQVDHESEDATASDEGDETGDDSAAEPKKAKGVQKRIDELTANWRGAERDRDYWRDLALRNQQQPPQQAQQPETPQSTSTSGEPRIDDFDDYDQYLIAKAKYEFRKEQEAERQQQQADKRQQQENDRVAAFQRKSAEARTKYQDFDAVMGNPNLPQLSSGVRDVLLDADNGADLGYYLAKHPDELARIVQLPSHLAAMEMGRISTRLSAPRKASETPPPVKPVGSGESSSKGLEQIEDMDEWMQRRNKEALGR